MDRKPCNNGFYFMDSYLYKPVTMCFTTLPLVSIYNLDFCQRDIISAFQFEAFDQHQCLKNISANPQYVWYRYPIIQMVHQPILQDDQKSSYCMQIDYHVLLEEVLTF